MRARLEILEPALVERIVDEALDVLARVGVGVGGDWAREQLAAAGLRGDAASGRVKIARAQVEQALASAPREVELYDRDGGLHATLGGGAPHFVPASSALKVMDRASGEPRDASSADFVEYVKVADGLEHLAYLSTAFVPKDVPADVADAWRLYLALAHSKQPVVSGAFTEHGVERMARIMQHFRGDEDELRRKPMAMFTCCPNTPLHWGEDPARNLIDCARWGIPVEIVPVLLLGMISPATTVGALVLHTAEVLSGLAIAQLVRPGAPIVFGGAPASFHMQLMTNPMTAVEALQVYAGYAQVARRLGLPSQAYMGLSDSKRCDMQAGAESAAGAYLAGLCGVDSVSGPGMLDYVNCFSLEKLVFDDELVAHVQRFLRPVEVKDDLPTMGLIEELLEEKHLLTSEHTLARWPEELYLPGPMVDRTNWDQWEMHGSKDERARAQEVIERCLEDYDVAPLPADVHRSIRDLFAATCDTPDATFPGLED